MQIIIPMSGFGERFRQAGYRVPKPLIEIDGKPIIAHVIDMFPGEHDFLFICNQAHLDEPAYGMRALLEALCPTGRILGIAPHKRGPVHAVLQAAELIDPQQPVVVNYCDFSCDWQWDDFCGFVQESACDGALPAYRGFHPHSLGSTHYAYIRETNGWAYDIQEKKPFTDNRLEEYASSGTYYFSSGQLMQDAMQACVSQNLMVNDEFYVSLAYKPLFDTGRKVAVYPLAHFMQWGTPQDVHEYLRWSDVFRRLSPQGQWEDPSTLPRHGTLIIPMAGLGQRFASAGYALTKPLIPVSGRPMVMQAVDTIAPTDASVFVLRRDMHNLQGTVTGLQDYYPNALIQLIDQVTDGQARTTRIGLQALIDSAGSSTPLSPVTIGACDFASMYPLARWQALLASPDVDVLVWTVRGHAGAIRHPHMYGWVDEHEGEIRSVSVKTPLSNPSHDPIILGAFTFKRAEDLARCIDRLIARDGRINGELYLDSCINDALELGLRCRTFEVDHYLSWGTPDDLRTFEYWQACFDAWPHHPYQIDTDPWVPAGSQAAVRAQYAAERPARPTPNSRSAHPSGVPA